MSKDEKDEPVSGEIYTSGELDPGQKRNLLIDNFVTNSGDAGQHNGMPVVGMAVVLETKVDGDLHDHHCISASGPSSSDYPFGVDGSPELLELTLEVNIGDHDGLEAQIIKFFNDVAMRRCFVEKPLARAIRHSLGAEDGVFPQTHSSFDY